MRDFGRLVGRTLGGRYAVRSVLGRGGMGVVYEAYDQTAKRPVALKVLDAVNPRAAERLRQEALAAASIDSPHVVKAYGFETVKNETFYVMELVRGDTLAKIFAREKPLTIERAVMFVDQMLRALDAAHTAGVVHRDVKPSNVIVVTAPDGTEHVKLTDFGIAKLLSGKGVRTTSGTILGTPAYLAPEQILSEKIEPRTDVHAAGIVLFELLAGDRPWQGRTSDIAISIVRDKAPDVAALRPDVPRALADVVACALAKAPSDRFPSAQAMRAALRPWRARPSAPPVVIAPPKKKPRTAPFMIALFATVTLGALGMVVAVGASLLRRKPRVVLAPPAPPPSSEPSTSAAPPSESPPIAEPSASIEPLASEAAPKPNPPRKVCHCREVRSGGLYFNLCERSLPGRCECVDSHGDSLCPERWSAEDMRTSIACPSMQSLSGNSGTPCTGFRDRSSIDRESGTKRCDHCYAPERNKPWSTGTNGEKCTGINTNGFAIFGTMFCE